MKPFKVFLAEMKSNNEINKMLTDYVSGKIEDYDNTESFINLFDPNGRGLPKLLSNFSLVILDDDNDLYSGKGNVIKPTMTFNLGVEGQFKPVKKLQISIAKTQDGTSYVIKHAKVL
jgi:hypothetical protein